MENAHIFSVVSGVFIHTYGLLCYCCHRMHTLHATRVQVPVRVMCQVTGVDLLAQIHICAPLHQNMNHIRVFFGGLKSGVSLGLRPEDYFCLECVSV